MSKAKPESTEMAEATEDEGLRVSVVVASGRENLREP
jgi:hypothetical protein